MSATPKHAPAPPTNGHSVIGPPPSRPTDPVGRDGDAAKRARNRATAGRSPVRPVVRQRAREATVITDALGTTPQRTRADDLSRPFLLMAKAVQ